MTISQAYELATDAQFRLLAGFTSPPRGGEVTAIEASGQVRVAMDDADGVDVLAWPLNGFTYVVGDIVYVAFANDSPESGIVIGSKGSVPVLDSGSVRTVLDTIYAQLGAANAFTQEQSITEESSALYAAGDASHNAYLAIDNPSQTTGTSAGIAFKVENAAGALQRWFMGLVSTVANYGKFVIKQRTGASTYAERLVIDENGRVVLPGPNASQDALVVSRVSGKASVKSSTTALVMDSAGDKLYLNSGVADHIQLGPGGGFTGIGVTTPAFPLQVESPSSGAKGIFLNGYEYYAPGSTNAPTTAGVLIFVGVSRLNNRQLWMGDRLNLGSATDGFLRTYGDNGSNQVQLDAISGDGVTEIPLVVQGNKAKLGIGVTPQQFVHAHNGTGGMMFTTAQTASTTPVVILANAAGDVVRGLAGQVVATDGSSSAANTFSMLVGDVQDIAVGSLVVRLTVTSTGQFDIRRQSGTGTATVALMFTWL